MSLLYTQIVSSFAKSSKERFYNIYYNWTGADSAPVFLLHKFFTHFFLKTH